MYYGFSVSRSGLPAYLFVMLDLIVATGAAKLSAIFRFGMIDQGLAYHLLALVLAFLLVVCFWTLGVYQPLRGQNLRPFLLKVFAGWWLSFSILFAILVFLKASENYSRIWVGTWFITGLVASLFSRLFIHWGLRYFRRHGRNSKRVLVLGNGRNFHGVLKDMAPGNDWGYRLDVCLEYNNMAQIKALLEDQLARDDHFDECWLCLPLKDSAVIQDIMYMLRNHTMDIRYMPGVRDMPLLNHKVTPIGGFYSLDLSCSPMADVNQTIKRLEDVLLSSVILILISPVMLAVAVAVKLTSEGPVLFKQKRLGVNGRIINVYKFRSMKVHSEPAGKVTQAIKGDPRLTPIGSFLRRTSLDELPQFFNVLTGRMSIVGPRPHALAHNEEYKERVDSYMKRHKVKPGITGLAQVNGLRGETETLDKMQKRVEMDLAYINSWSVFLDLKIIILTVFRGFFDPNAY
uniref:undecaprenyl-phosphate glucose phosphotransferase n=1 Tax=Endozoicomonas sp. Mp262 TaxID=2919499 RepID=UPI00351B528A